MFSPPLFRDSPCRRHPRRHPHRHRTRRVLLDNYAASILIDIVLVASYLTSSKPPVSSSTSYSLCRIVQLPAVSVPLRAALTISRSSMIFSPHLFRDSPCRRHPRRHPHRHRTRHVLLDNHPAGSSSTSYLSRLT